MQVSPSGGDPLRGFRRHSLAEQAATILEDLILRGEMPEVFPGENQLSAKLKISRPTLRQAIQLLARRGLVTTSKGRRTRVCLQGKESVREMPAVCLIIPASMHSSTAVASTTLEEMKFELAASGITWDAVFESQLGGRHPDARLEEITAGRRQTVYILFSPSYPLQLWFAESGLPTLILGSCYEGIELPSIDIDYHAVGWHAAGQLVKNGHSRILFVEPASQPVGVISTERGINEYFGKAGNADLLVLRKSDDGKFLMDIEKILRSSNPPTACLSCRAEVTLSVLAAASRIGKCVPRDLSLISRDPHPILEVIEPEITRYVWDGAMIVRKATRLLHGLMRGITPRNHATLIFPEFIEGTTLQRI